MNHLPGSLTFSSCSFGYVEPKVVGGGLVHEMQAVEKAFNLMEFIFDQPMIGFHIGLPGKGTWEKVR